MASDAYLPPAMDAVKGPSPQAVAEYLSDSVASLRSLTSLRICEILGKVHSEWAAANSPSRREAAQLLAATTGYARRTLDRSLRHLFVTLTEEGLREWLLNSAREGRGLVGPPLIGVIAAGNLPGTAIPSLIQTLLLRSACIVKSSSAEPCLMPLYVRSLASRSPELAQAMAIMTWPREDVASTAALLQTAGALIAYGSDATLTELRNRFPESRPFIGYGHRLSFSVIGERALTWRRAKASARSTALDLAMFDQQGCLSPQAMYVERGGQVSPSAFGSLLADELERLQTRLPRRKLSPEESSAIHQFRAEFEMRSLARRGSKLWQSEEGTAWTVALEPSLALEPCPLNRTALLYPFDKIDEIGMSLSPWRGHLISCGMAVSARQQAALRSSLYALGVTRFCNLGEAQFPTAEEILLHDGVNPLRILGEEHGSSS
jgi:hypothetical protein